MRSGPRAGATRSSGNNPALRPGPQASRADLNITTTMFPRAGRLRSLDARRSSTSSAQRRAPCRRHARRDTMTAAKHDAPATPCSSPPCRSQRNVRRWHAARRHWAHPPRKAPSGRVWPRPTRGLGSTWPPATIAIASHVVRYCDRNSNGDSKISQSFSETEKLAATTGNRFPFETSILTSSCLRGFPRIVSAS